MSERLDASEQGDSSHPPSCGRGRHLPEMQRNLLGQEGDSETYRGWSLNKLLTKYVGLESDSQLVCPNCGGLMEIEDAGNVRVDVCLDCKGVWLDAGELERLAAMDPAEFRKFTPEKIEQLQKAKEIREDEHRQAIRSLFRGLRRP